MRVIKIVLACKVASDLKVFSFDGRMLEVHKLITINTCYEFKVYEMYFKAQA